MSRLFRLVLESVSTSNEIELVTATLDDVPAIMEFQSEIEKEKEREGFGLSEEQIVGYIEQQSVRQPNLVLLARCEGKIVGYVILHESVNDTASAFIYKIAVLSDYRSHGIGLKLLTKVIEEMKQQGITYLELIVRRVNEKAIRWYERNGFVRTASEGIGHTYRLDL